MRLAATGTLDLGSRQMQMVLAVRPLGTLDDVVASVPLLGPALLGKDGVLTLTYEATGPLDAPAVHLAGARPLGRPVLERLLKVLEGPEPKP